MTHQRDRGTHIVADGTLVELIKTITGVTSAARLATLLGSPKNRFITFMRGKAHITQTTIMRQDWPGKLAAAFPQAWIVHGDAFMRALAEQRARVGAPRKTKIRGSPFALALKVLIGVYPRRRVAAAIGISAPYLSRVLGGYVIPSRAQGRSWLPVLRQLLPMAWKVFGHNVVAAVATLPERPLRAVSGGRGRPSRGRMGR